MRSLLFICFTVIWGLLGGLCHADSSFKVSTFQVDVTVPLGHAMMGGGIPPAKEIVTPLYAQGIVLHGADKPIVWLSVDWCEIRNDAYDAWRDALAKAAGTTRERVLLAAIHQHDTPVADFTAQALLDEVGLEKSLCDVPFVKDCIARSATALKASLKKAVPVSHYGVGSATVEGVASNRRIVEDDGKVAFSRGSSSPNRTIGEMPIGLIDPYLRTLSFWNGKKPVAAMSTYAVHPMSFYGEGGVGYDFVGMAREQMKGEIPGVQYLYFSGCSGDVVAGKYNDRSPEERPKLAGRMYAAMHEAWVRTVRYELTVADFRSVTMQLPMRETEAFVEAEQRKVLENPEAKQFKRNLAAMGLSWRKAHAEGRGIDVPSVDFGKAQFLLMPAESFVYYQLQAQKERPDQVVLVAGYGESAPGYIPSPQAIEEKFIEDHTWCWVHYHAPEAMHDAMKRSLMEPR